MLHSLQLYLGSFRLLFATKNLSTLGQLEKSTLTRAHADIGARRSEKMSSHEESRECAEIAQLAAFSSDAPSAGPESAAEAVGQATHKPR